VRNPVSAAQFRRDVKLAQKRGKDMAKLRELILLLIEGRPCTRSRATVWPRLQPTPLTIE
jgi:mRNA interferase YafQ